MGDLLKGCDMNNRNKLIELFIYIVIVVVGIVLSQRFSARRAAMV